MLHPENYSISIAIFFRLIGCIYFFAFGAFLFQIKGLLGKKGILPVQRYLEFIHQLSKKRWFYYAPSLFWIRSTDFALMFVTAVGTILSILLFFGVYPSLLLFLLYIFYISIVSVGQDFLSFGWEMFFLEITANAFFLSLDPTNVFVWISLNLLLFRFHFQGGAVKLQSRDPNWLNLTAIAYHYQSQPLPNATAWFVYKLPLWFHKFSTLFMFFDELIVPFAIFTDSELIRLIVFILLAGLQIFIWLTGNFSYLNHLTLVLCIPLIANSYLKPFIPFTFSYAPAPIWLQVIVSIFGVALLTLQIMNLWNHFFIPNRVFARALHAVQPFHLANRYGIFAVMTTVREEIVIEGSEDGVTWKEYGFYHKPSELNRRPRRISPYQPRLDWQVWFLPFRSYNSEPWFHNFLYRLLQGSPEVLRLLRVNPFPKDPPKYIRVNMYDYTFTDYKTWRKTGNWWDRELTRSYSPTLTLKKD